MGKTLLEHEKFYIPKEQRDLLLSQKPKDMTKSTFWKSIIEHGTSNGKNVITSLKQKVQRELEWTHNLCIIQARHEGEIQDFLESEDGWNMEKMLVLLKRHEKEIHEYLIEVLNLSIEIKDIEPGEKENAD